jgi:hypothetical protein
MLKRLTLVVILTAFSVITSYSTVLLAQDQKSEQEHPPVPPLGTPAPMREDFGSHWAECDSEQCAGIAPAPLLGIESLTRTSQRTRGSNSQLAIPQNLLFADVNADGATDFLQYASNKIFVSKTDFEKTGILHLYTPRPIKRVLTGDFHGDRYDQVCVITDNNMLRGYGISNNRQELWWWFTQGSFVKDNEDTIVGDFDGDGRDDVLVYPHVGGPFRMYSVKGSFFFNPTPKFKQGDLEGVAISRMQVRAGDFNGDGRDDVLIANQWHEIIYYVSVFDGTNNTFLRSFATKGFVNSNDQVTVARIDDNAIDDVVLRNRVTGATRFFRMKLANGVLQAITNVSTGQIRSMGNSLLFWSFMRGPVQEPGSDYREDAMVYDLSTSMFSRSAARWDGHALTYWWAYTQHAPNNHTGWADFTAKPWLVLKCRISDISDIPQNDQFYRDLNASLVGYWRDVSYGSWDLSGNTVIDRWYLMSITNAAWQDTSFSRRDRCGTCIKAYGGSTSGYVNVISFVNGDGDWGNAGGPVLIIPRRSNVTALAHETGHTFGWGHSYDDTGRKNSRWSAPGEYYDRWDIMSAMNVHTFSTPQGFDAGPELNAPYKAKKSFIPAHRLLQLTWNDITQGKRINIAALNRPEANGPLMVRFGSNDKNYYTIEYRMKSGWDQGIPRAAVLVHRVTDGKSYLITEGGTERLAGSVSSFPLDGRKFVVQVHNFATEGYTADVTVTRNLNTSVDEKTSDMPKVFTLMQNYPNPFNPSTTISFALPEAAKVTLKVYDMLGREVATLVDSNLPAGFHSAIFESKNLPSGMYFYRMQAEGFTQTRKLMLTK